MDYGKNIGKGNGNGHGNGNVEKIHEFSLQNKQCRTHQPYYQYRHQ